MKDGNCIIVKRCPTVEEYQRLRQGVGWSNIDTKAAEIALPNSLFSVCAIYKDEVIGCGRVVGDSGIYFYVQDIIVLPQFQKNGIGKRIMEAITNYFTSSVSSDAFIGLMAAKGVSRFYEKLGFIVRPEDSPGMHMKRDKKC